MYQHGPVCPAGWALSKVTAGQSYIEQSITAALCGRLADDELPGGHQIKGGSLQTEPHHLPAQVCGGAEVCKGSENLHPRLPTILVGQPQIDAWQAQASDQAAVLA